MRQVLVLGKRGQGKSTLVLRLALLEGRTALVFDPNGQYKAFPHHPIGTGLLSALFTGQSRVIVVQPHYNSTVEDFQRLADIIWPESSDLPIAEHFSIVIDECSYLQSPSWIEPKLERFLRLAPPDVLVAQTTHRLTDVNRLSRTLSTDVFLFSNQSGHDGKTIDVEFESSDMAAVVAGLPLYHCVHYSIAPNGRRTFSVWSNPDEWKLDIGGTVDGRRTESRTAA